MKSKPSTSDRPKQELPSEIIGDLLGVIRRQFYGDAEPTQWLKDQTFIKREVVTWPAAWLNKRGVTLPPARYKAILLDIFDGIKTHGATGAVKY